MTELLLHEKLSTGAEFLGGSDWYKQNIPDFICKNLNPDFQLRSYQLEAFGRFKYYMESYSGRPQSVPTQILFHMATGSGKTLIMAGLMLYLYNQDYRNFLFDDGRAFEPDFVLCLIKDDKAPALHYQVIIEPKGSHLIKHDEWKQTFLLQLKKEHKHKIKQLWKDKNYIIWGMPFYNETETKPEFEEEFSVLL